MTSIHEKILGFPVNKGNKKIKLTIKRPFPSQADKNC